MTHYTDSANIIAYDQQDWKTDESLDIIRFSPLVKLNQKDKNKDPKDQMPFLMSNSFSGPEQSQM